MIKKLLMIIAALMVFHVSKTALDYDDKITHPRLTEVAIVNSDVDDYLKTILGIIDGKDKKYNGKTVAELLQDASTNEDLALRAKNHFWDPTRNLGLDDEGYAVVFGVFPIPAQAGTFVQTVFYVSAPLWQIITIPRLARLDAAEAAGRCAQEVLYI